MPELAALDLLRGWNKICLPAWSESELVQQLNSALTTRLAPPPGHLLEPNIYSLPTHQRSGTELPGIRKILPNPFPANLALSLQGGNSVRSKS